MLEFKLILCMVILIRRKDTHPKTPVIVKNRCTRGIV